MIIKPKFGVGGAVFRVIALLLVSTFVLDGCTALNWFSSHNSSKKPKVNVEGKRISVLTFDKPLEVSDSMVTVEVDVPKPYLNEDWPQTGGYSSHTMYNLKGPSRLKKLWEVKVGTGGEIGSRIVMSPIVAEGKVFAMDTDVRVAAFNAKSGKGIWRTDLAVSVEKPQVGFGGGLAYADGKVFAATGFGDVFALNPSDGSILWRQKLNEAFRTAPTVGGGRIYVTSFNNQLFVLDQTDGHILWNYRAIAEGAHILAETSPAVAGDAMVAPFSSGELIAFLADNGQVTWQDSLTRTGRLSSISTMNDIAGSPVIDNGQVFAVSHSGRMVAIDLRSGQRIWSNEIASIDTPWIAGDFIYQLTTEGQLVCIYRRDGSIKWIAQLKAYTDPKTRKNPVVWSGPIMVGGVLMVSSSRKQALLVNPHDGKVLKGINLPDKVFTAPIIADNIVYVYTNDAHLIALGDPALEGPAHPSQPTIHHKAKPLPGELVKDKRGFFHTPEWMPVF